PGSEGPSDPLPNPRPNFAQVVQSSHPDSVPSLPPTALSRKLRQNPYIREPLAPTRQPFEDGDTHGSVRIRLQRGQQRPEGTSRRQRCQPRGDDKLGAASTPGFTITTKASRAYLHDGTLPPQLRVEVTTALRAIEDEMRRQLGDF